MTDAQKAEAKKTTVSVEFEGDTYEVDPTSLTWDTLEALAAAPLSDHSMIGFALDLLGKDQYAEFKRRHPSPLARLDGNVVNVAYSLRVAILAALGNSEASSGS